MTSNSQKDLKIKIVFELHKRRPKLGKNVSHLSQPPKERAVLDFALSTRPQINRSLIEAMPVNRHTSQDQ